MKPVYLAIIQRDRSDVIAAIHPTAIEDLQLLYTRRIVTLVRVSGQRVVLLLFLLFTLVPDSPCIAASFSRPPFPVIFVHGINSSSQAWRSLTDFVRGGGWTFGGFPTFDPATGSVDGVSPGDFYTMNFSDFNLPDFPSQHLTVARQGAELAEIIRSVRDANPGKDHVILVTHSIGGLAARAYVQGLARFNGAVPPIVYRGDVAQLITIGTPHLGSELAVVCQLSAQQVCLQIGIDPTSQAVNDLRPDSQALGRLNDLASNPLPQTVSYQSVVGFGASGLAGLGHHGDGIVTSDSQRFLAGVPGIVHKLAEVLILNREDCGTSLLVFEETHTCETSDSGVQFVVVDAILDPHLILSLDNSAYSDGDTLTLTLTTEPGFPAPENVGDLYFAAQVPDGTFFIHNGTAFGSVLVPFRSATTITSGTEIIFSFQFPAGFPVGTYTCFALLVTAGTSPTNSANWLSNLAQVSFTLTTPPPGTISVAATLDGAPWAGSIAINASTPLGSLSNFLLPVPFTTGPLPPGSYAVAFHSGGPPGTTFQGITPSPAQALAPGATTTLTFNFSSAPAQRALVLARADQVIEWDTPSDDLPLLPRRPRPPTWSSPFMP